MKKYMLLLAFLIIAGTGFADSSHNSFFIEMGKKDYQIGYKAIDGFCVSPSGIAEKNGIFYILDTAMYKVNVYSKSGQFIESYKIPGNNDYHNLTVDAKGRIYLLAEQGIFVITNKSSVKKLRSLPPKIATPYDICVDNKGNIAINGNKGSGIFDPKGNYKEFPGGVFLTLSGLVGVLSDDCLVVNKKGKIIKKIKINSEYILFGISEDFSVYYVLPPVKNGVIIRKVDSNGKITDKKVEYDFGLISDPLCYEELFHVGSKGEVIMLGLDSKAKKLKVSIVNF